MSKAQKSDEKKDAKSQARAVGFVPTKSFNLKNYIQQYTGVIKIHRLIYIGEHCPELSLEAYRTAIAELKKGVNTNLFTDVVARARELFGDKLGDEYGLDQKWINNANREFQEKLVRLEADSSNARREGEKELIRRTYDELARHFVARGDFTSALSKYFDSVAGSYEDLNTCVNIIRASIYLGTMSDVKNQAVRAQNHHTGELAGDVVRQSIINAAVGLHNLKVGNFFSAAKAFMNCDIAIADKFNDVITRENIVAYGSLAALVSHNRHELKEQVLNNFRFKPFLEMFPAWRKIIEDYQASRYTSCFQALERMRPDLLLDMYISPHVGKIIDQTLSRALAQYFRPFTSVKLSNMAAAFGMDINVLERHLAQLIADGKISARIDSHSKVLTARHADQRSATFEKALGVGNKYARDCKAMLLRLSLVENDFVVRPKREDHKE